MTDEPRNRVVVVTGASSGIGKAAATMLAQQGWHVIAHGRDPARTAAAEAEIRATAPAARVDFIRADLAEMADVARMAREIAAVTDRVDVVLANAGGLGRDRVVTAEGNEATFAGNHLGHFLLVDRLLPLIRAAVSTAAPGATRIVSVSSNAHRMSHGFDWNDMQLLDGFATGPAYCNVKLANLLFTRSLSHRLAADGIVVNAMDPGVVDSNFASYGDEATQRRMATLDKLSADEAGGALAWMAAAPEAGAVSGRLFFDRKEVAASEPAQDDDAAERLWHESMALIANVPA